MLFRLAAAVIGVLLLSVGYGFWDPPPDPQVATVGDADEVVTKETKTTWNDKTEVTTEPAVAVAGRSEAVSIAFLLVGGLVLIGAALPDRNVTLKAAGAEAAITRSRRGGTGSGAASGQLRERAAWDVRPNSVVFFRRGAWRFGR